MPGKKHELILGELPARGKRIAEEVYEESRERGKSKQYSAKVAWSATRKAGYTKKSYAKK